MPLFAANPTKVKMNAAKIMAGESVEAMVIRVLQLRVPIPSVFSVNVNNKIKPMKERACKWKL